MSTKEEIFEYVTETPENTNPAVLRSMLNELSGGGSGGAGLFVVNIQYNDSTGEYEVDKTLEEIKAAYLRNDAIVGVYAGQTVFAAPYLEGEGEEEYFSVDFTFVGYSGKIGDESVLTGIVKTNIFIDAESITGSEATGLFRLP